MLAVLRHDDEIRSQPCLYLMTDVGQGDRAYLGKVLPFGTAWQFFDFDTQSGWRQRRTDGSPVLYYSIRPSGRSIDGYCLEEMRSECYVQIP